MAVKSLGQSPVLNRVNHATKLQHTAPSSTTTAPRHALQSEHQQEYAGSTAQAAQLPMSVCESGPGVPLHSGVMSVNPNVKPINQFFTLAQASIEEPDLVSHYDFTNDNMVEILVNGPQAFAEIFSAVDNATESINVSFYIFKDDKLGNEFADKLIAKAKQGLDVRLMVDGIGSSQMLPSARKIIDRIEAGGVKIIRNHMVNLTNPAEQLNHPDHRKLVLVDGKTAFTGGMNMADDYVDDIHDTMVKIEGSTVQQMQLEWLKSWLHLGGSISDSLQSEQAQRKMLFPEPIRTENGMRTKVIQAIPGENPEIFANYLELFNTAQKRILIEMPYCTNPEIQDALMAAAKRGVDVQIILPGESDHSFSSLAAKSKYPEMLEAGIHIFEYPGFSHSKVVVIDDDKVAVGSSNLDDIALRHVYELNVLVEDEEFADDVVNKIFVTDLPKCTAIDLEDVSSLDLMLGTFFNMFHDVI